MVEALTVLRKKPRIWRGGTRKAERRFSPPPSSRPVEVEVYGVGSGLKRIDIVADDQTDKHPAPFTLSLAE